MNWPNDYDVSDEVLNKFIVNRRLPGYKIILGEWLDKMCPAPNEPTEEQQEWLLWGDNN